MLGLNRYLEAEGVLPAMENTSAWKIAERLNLLLGIAGTNRKVIFDHSTIPASLKFGFASSTRTTKKSTKTKE